MYVHTSIGLCVQYLHEIDYAYLHYLHLSALVNKGAHGTAYIIDPELLVNTPSKIGFHGSTEKDYD